MKRKTLASKLSPNQQRKYLAGLRGKAREQRAAEILYRRTHRSNKPFATDKGRTTKRSEHAIAFEQIYGRPAHDVADVARLTGVPRDILEQVYARGMAAWQTGHRPGASQHAWALARVYSFVTGGPTMQGPDKKLAIEAGLAKPNPVDQTQTPAFKRWFGNSKVVDADGKPLVVYHGTPNVGFTAFKMQNVGVFFSDRFDVAASYAGRYDTVEFDDEGAYTDSMQGVYEAYLSLQNPLIVDFEGRSWGNGPSGLKLDDLAARAKRTGHDGLIAESVVDTGWLSSGFVTDSGESTVFVVFRPEQIKSATANKGTFDPHDADIRNPAPEHGPWIPPPAVAAAAKQGQQLRAKQPKSNQCCMATGIARAKQLSSRSPVSYKDLVTMRAWFARHAVDARGKGWGKDSKGFQAFLMWGGAPGKKWCEDILRRLGK